MNIIDERDKRNRARRRMKEQYDSAMTLSVENRWYRLLQEGMITYSDGSPYFYIAKGTIRSFYDSLDPTYEGSINIGHTDLATFPERIVGKWTKADLRVVDIEDGRQALETTLPVNTEHPLIQALSLSPFDVGLSVEMRMNVNDAMTRNEAANPFGVPVVDEIEIYDFAIVGNAGDVNSMGVSLKGELPKMDERLKKLAALLDEEGTTSLADVTKLLEDSLGEAESKTEEPKAEETEELSEETVEASEEAVEASAEEAEEVAEEAEKEPETDDAEVTEASAEEKVDAPADTSAFDDILAQISALKEELEAVKAQLQDKNAEIEAKDEELKAANAKLAAKEADEQAFVKKFKNLSVALTKEVKREEAPKSQYTDGIGE